MKKLLVIFLALFMADCAFARGKLPVLFRDAFAKAKIRPYGAEYHASKILYDSLSVRLDKKDDRFRSMDVALVNRRYRMEFLP